MREPYFPIFTSVVRSSLWSLSGDCIKVFLTLCAEADPEGFCSASVDGIRRIADLPLEDTRAHLERLESPDAESKDRTRDAKCDGRRIERVPNGWRIVNLEWYRDQARKQAELARKRKWWNEKGTGARRDARRTQTETQTYLSEDREIDPPTPVNPAKGRFAPADLTPTDAQRLRCQELRFDVDGLLRDFKLQEFNRDYADWPRRFSKWIEDQKIRRETTNGAKPRKAGSRQPNVGLTGFEGVGGAK